jgi:hypothetical protein
MFRHGGGRIEHGGGWIEAGVRPNSFETSDRISSSAHRKL